MEQDYEGQAIKRKETAAARQKRLNTAACAVMNSEAGRLILSEILGYCQVESINSLDGVAAGRVEGARAVGLRTLNLLRDADTGLFLKLYTELFCNDR
jgi:hypothetical protein